MLNKTLAQLHKEAFDDQDPKWRSASIDASGVATRWECKKEDLVINDSRGPCWLSNSIYYFDYEDISNGWDSEHWKELVINRDDYDEGYQYTVEGVDIDSTASSGGYTEPNSSDIPF